MQKELIINGLKYVLVEDNDQIYEHNGLMWTKTFSKMSWNEAILFCKNLKYGGYSDWRLPVKKELMSIICETIVNPTCVLPDTMPSHYWSSTNLEDYIGSAWSVGFYNGGVEIYGFKSSALYVRAVRS